MLVSGPLVGCEENRIYLYGLPPQSHHPHLIMRKASGKFYNIPDIFLKAVKVIKNKENLRNCHNQEKPKKT